MFLFTDRRHINMCQEYHCDCCYDEFPADSCKCLECFHGDQDNEEGDKLLQTGKFPSKSCSSENNRSPEACTSKPSCGGENDLCNEEKASPCCSSSTKETFEEEKARQSVCKSECCSTNEEDKIKPVLLSENTSQQQESQPLQPDCCNSCQPTERSVDDNMAGRPNSKDSTCSKSSSPCQSSRSPKRSQGDTSAKSSNPGDAVRRFSAVDTLCTTPSSPLLPKESGSSEKKLIPQQRTTKLRVQNICCLLESGLIQDTLKPLEGVTSVAVNVIGRVVYVRHEPEVTSATDLVTTLNRKHLGASIMETGSHHSANKGEGLPRSLLAFLIYLLLQSILLIVIVVAFLTKAKWFQWVAIAEIVLGIPPVLKKAFLSIINRTVDINIMMLIAIAGTLAIQEWLQGAAVVYVFSFAEAMQGLCMFKVQRTISGLMLEAPQVAILAKTGECVSVESVITGTAIAIRPGELIPLDGVVVKGQAAVDESSVSGESVPVGKTVGAKVYSGTVNQNGYLEIETTSDATSSTVSKVAQLVQEAQTSSTRTEVAINRFAKYYTPTVVIVAALVVIVPAILGAAGVGNYSHHIKEWGLRALVLLVIACPCALVMSTPIAVVCGITAAARRGALIKGGAHLETLAQLEVLAFDKTGTLTEGKFQVVDIECSFGVNERATLRLAAALESKSSHPLAAAIVNEFSGCVTDMVTSQSVVLPEVSRFELHGGQGISGIVEGHLVQIGNYEFLNDIAGIKPSKYMKDKYNTWCDESKTVIFVCLDGNLAMMLALADTIRQHSLETIEWLRKLRVQSAMITGDNSQTAMAVKNKLGLDECIAKMKPQNKLSWVKDRQAVIDVGDGEMLYSDRCFASCCCSCDNTKNCIVGMVGDGINDGPALAAANVGIAMGAGGTALAVEAADVALMTNNLAKIPELIELGRFCRLVVAENIALSVVLKLAMVIAALAGKVSLWMAVLADVLGLLFVILNGLRPLWSIKEHEDKHTDVELALVKNAGNSYSYGAVASND